MHFSFESSRNDLEAHTTHSPKLKRRLRAARNRHRITRQKLADKLGISRETVDRWESGEREPGMRMYAALYKIFGEEIMPIVPESKPREKIRLARYRYGMSQEEAAESMNRSAHWMMQIEKTQRPLSREDQKLLEVFVLKSFEFRLP